MEYTPITKEQSKNISLLKGVAILMVVMIHCWAPSFVDAAPLSSLDLYLQCLCGEIAFDACPVFFFVSGFLFFLRQSSYTDKWKKRVKSLVIPYVVWCLIGFAIPFFFQEVCGLSSLYRGQLKLVADFTFADYVRMFWNIRDGAPILSTLWFLRNLIVLVALTPVIAGLIRLLKKIFPIMSFIVYLWSPLGSICGDFFFFSLGCWFALTYSGGTLKILDRQQGRVVAILWVVLLVVTMLNYGRSDWYVYFHRIFLIIDCIATYKVVSFFSSKGKTMFLERISMASFFIYLFHEPWLGYFQALFFRLLDPPLYVKFVLPWFFLIFAVSYSYAVWFFLKKFAPRFLGVISGSR